MPPLDNRQWESFCVEYFGGKTKKKSAITAGYSPKTAQQIASRLLRKVKVLERLQELQERLTQVMRGRLSDFMEFGPDGSWTIRLEAVNSSALLIDLYPYLSK